MSAVYAGTSPTPYGHTYGDFGVLLDPAGREVWARNSSWHLNHATRPVRLNWRRIGTMRPAVFTATQSFVAEVVKTYSATTARAYFEHLVYLSNFPSFLEGERSGGNIEFSVIMALRTALGEAGYGVRLLRDWYSWCADQGHSGFCPETAFRLEEVAFGGNRKAVAVRTMDPEGGPLVDTEVVGHRQLVELRLRWGAIGTACSWLRRSGDAGDLGPSLEGLAPGGSILGGRHLMAAKVEEVADPIVGGQEALRLAG